MERVKVQELMKWYNSKLRKPLILWGARQIGKSYLIHELFAKKHFKDFAYIDVKKNAEAREFFSNTCDPAEYLSYIETRFHKKISPTVPLIFDEVQACPNILTSLKYFCQDFRELPVIATGSMVRLAVKQVEAKKNDDEFLFPVGKIDSMMLYPVSFEEYLLNTNPLLMQKIKDAYDSRSQLKSPYHEMAMDSLHEYLTIGGLPEPLDIFIQTKSYVDATKTLKEVYKNYIADMSQYNVSDETILKTRNLYKNIFSQLNKENKNFKITAIEKGKSNRDYFNAYQWLELSHVVYRSRNLTGKITLPIIEKSDGLFRLYLADEGIFVHQSKVSQADFFVRNNRNTLSGIFYENYVACEFAANEIPLYYWTGKSTHEFEFIVHSGGKLYAIDTKKSKGNLNSLKEFRDYNPNAKAIKISANNFGYNEENDILTIPHYAVFLLAKELGETGS